MRLKLSYPPLTPLPTADAVYSSYGFIKYYNFKDAENCIRGFHYLGYEVSFARVF